MKLADAIMKAALIQQRLARGLDPRQSLRPLGDWFDAAYLPAIRPTNRSWRSDRSRFDTHVRPVLGGRPVCEITALDLTRLIQGLRPAPNRCLGRGQLATSTVNRVVALLKSMFARLVADGLLDINPAAGLKLCRERNERGRVLRDGEFPRFFAALADVPVKVRLLVTFMILTGVRLGEALAARWSEVDLEQRNLRLPDTKAGRPRDVPLSPEALLVCRDLQAVREPGNDHLFPGKCGGPMSRPSRHFRALIAAADTPGLWLHDLRRTFATLAAQHVPIHEVSRFLGHSAVHVTERYVVTHDARLHATAAAVGRCLGPVLAGLAAPTLDGAE